MQQKEILRKLKKLAPFIDDKNKMSLYYFYCGKLHRLEFGFDKDLAESLAKDDSYIFVNYLKGYTNNS